MQSVRVDGWRPVNTQARISNPIALIERLGGAGLYGIEFAAPIRELIQNAVDAIGPDAFLMWILELKEEKPKAVFYFICISRLKRTNTSLA